MHPYTSTKLSFTGTLVVTRRTRSAMINDRSGSSQPPMKKAKLAVTLATTVESGLFPAESSSLVLQGEPHISIFRQSYLSISVADVQGSTAGRRGTKPYRVTGDKPKERRKKRARCWMRRSFFKPVNSSWKVGAHVSVAGGVENAVTNAIALGFVKAGS